MENNKSGKFPPSALIKAVGENLPAHFFILFLFFYLRLKGETVGTLQLSLKGRTLIKKSRAGARRE